jgi:hypothetical protein
LPARCCQLAVVGGVIYADLRVSLALTYPCRLCFLRVLLCMSLCYKLSPVQEHWGRWHCTRFLRPVVHFSSCGKWVFPRLLCSFPPTATFTIFPAPDYWAVLLLLPAAMFVYSSRGKWAFPPLLWSFPPSATLTSFPAPGCWARIPASARASPARPACLFTVPGRIPFPQSSALSAPHPLSHVSLLFLLLISQFLFFSQGGGLSLQGAMLLWPRLVCGSTAVLLSLPCLRLPKPSGHGWLAARGPSLFLHLTWSGDSLCWLEVWRSQSFASSRWFCLQSVSAVSLQDFTIGGSLSVSSL